MLRGPLSEIIQKYWKEGNSLIFLGAIGAVVRLVAPFIRKKDIDPAVLVIDPEGYNIIPLLGAHKAGAESFAQDLAEDLGGKAIFTSESKRQGLLPLDSFGKNWGWNRSGDMQAWNKLMIKQVKGEKIFFHQLSGSELWQSSKSGLTSLFALSSQALKAVPCLHIGPQRSEECCWHPPTLWVGIGCERNTSKNLIYRAIEESFEKSDLNKEAIAGIATIDLKSDELGLMSLIDTENWPVNFYSVEELTNVSVPNPSERVNKEIGTYSVAEASAILAAGQKSELLCEKKIYRPKEDEHGAVTIAIAQSILPFAPQRGELHLVGSGPGDIAFLTNDSRFALSRCVIWTGYGLYLDLLEPLRRDDQIRLDGELTFERERCQHALELAKQGARVALISSGDSGIYGMAGLALELWLDQSKSHRPKFEVHPGISALQMAAAKTGAPLMNDFCTISLSDLLNPWEKIEERIKYAALGDFVIAIYNPSSKKRNWQLAKALEIIRNYRSADIPIALCRQLGREQEEINLYTLDSLPLNQVDMLSVLIIGNSLSLSKDEVFITPRGYPLN